VVKAELHSLVRMAVLCFGKTFNQHYDFKEMISISLIMSEALFPVRIEGCYKECEPMMTELLRAKHVPFGRNLICRGQLQRVRSADTTESRT
jgi:hypothetical protein